MWKAGGTEMGETTSPFGESLELDYKGNTIRALMVNSVPWYSLSDILVACNLKDCAAERVHKASFPPFGKMLAGEADDPAIPGEGSDTVLLSPVGVFYWASEVDACRLSGVTAWARRTARGLCPKQAPRDPAMFLTLTKDADGWTYIPPGTPPRYSGWMAEYEDLKWGDYPAWCAASEGNAALNRKAREEIRRDGAKADLRTLLGLDGKQAAV
jgi:hypothetical protein